MSLTPQEQHCVDLALSALGDLYGGSWRFDHSLDDLHNSNASPECIVTSDTIDAAIEVKRLTGDDVARGYKEALLSLPRALDPRCQGFYVLGPAANLRVPVDRPLLRTLRKEVARVAPTLARGETGGVRVPRSSWVSLCAETGPGRVNCCHNYSEHLFEGLESSITGTFLLVDQGLPDHNFVTSQALARFRNELAAACYRRVHGGSNHFDWYEEIPLLRCDSDDDNGPGLDVLAVTEARRVDTAVAEGLDYILERAIRKFDRQPPWASIHIIVLDREDGFSSPERVTTALSWITDEDLKNIDLILLVDRDDVSVVWQSDTEVAQQSPSRRRL